MAVTAVPKLESESLLRGDSRTWTDTFTVNTGTDTVPVWSTFDLSGWGTWECQIRGDLDRGTVIATVDVDATDAATGIIVRKLTADQADLLPGQADTTKPVVYMDLQATRTSDGFRQTFRRWKVTVQGDVSDV